MTANYNNADSLESWPIWKIILCRIIVLLSRHGLNIKSECVCYLTIGSDKTDSIIYIYTLCHTKLALILISNNVKDLDLTGTKTKDLRIIEYTLFLIIFQVGKGLSKNEKAQKLALRHWLEAVSTHSYSVVV